MAAEAQFRVMGCAAHLIVDGDQRLLDAARVRLDDLEARWSRFRPDSELSRLNAGVPTRLSADTFALISAAVAGWHATGGRFDPTILPALVAAGYDRTFARIDPDRPAGAAHPSPGCADIPLTNPLTLPPGVALDLGGIAKGYAADELSNLPAEAVCVNLGGDVRVRGRDWDVAIADPFGPGDLATVRVADGGVCTSSRTRRRWRGGHHLIDPATGAAAFPGRAAVTVLAATATDAEIWAKAAFLGGLGVLPGLTGLAVDDAGAVQVTADFQEYAQWTTSSGGTYPAPVG